MLGGKGKLLRKSAPYLETGFPLFNLSRVYFRRFNSYHYTCEIKRCVGGKSGARGGKLGVLPLLEGTFHTKYSLKHWLFR